MISSRNSPLLLLLLDGVFFHGDRTVDAFVIKRQGDICHYSDSVLVLNTFSYLGGGDDSYNQQVEEYPTATSTFQPSFEQQQPFPFASTSIPEPAFDFPVRQEEVQQQEYQTEYQLRDFSNRIDYAFCTAQKLIRDIPCNVLHPFPWIYTSCFQWRMIILRLWILIVK